MEALKLKDFLSYRYLSGVQYAPDGSKAAFVVANTNERRAAMSGGSGSGTGSSGS